MIYLPNFTDSRVIAFCGSNGVSVDGFYKSLLTATGQTSGHIDDLWSIYLTTKYGYYNGPHINGYEDEASFTFSAGGGVPNFLWTDDTSILYTDNASVILET